MMLWKLGSELPNLVEKFQSVLKIWTKCRLNSHEVEYFHEVKRTQVSQYASEKQPFEDHILILFYMEDFSYVHVSLFKYYIRFFISN